MDGPVNSLRHPSHWLRRRARQFSRPCWFGTVGCYDHLANFGRLALNNILFR